MAAYDGGADSQVAALSALASARLLVPVVAVLGEVEVDERGLAHDKTSDMAAVLLEGADGRLAMLAFTGTDSLAAWNPEARPVPVSAQTAAQSALQEEAAALVVDLAGPATFVLEGDDLLGVASGWTLTRVGDRSAWRVE
nr:SseB family protein [Nocardioides lijunqiniae]